MCVSIHQYADGRYWVYSPVLGRRKLNSSSSYNVSCHKWTHLFPVPSLRAQLHVDLQKDFRIRPCCFYEKGFVLNSHLYIF